jgi:hypothetical protein
MTFLEQKYLLTATGVVSLSFVKDIFETTRQF